jgi:bifunctional DNA-binding transcriptional regulator/antitoxin component of YhaV-PrlF toxin-antitoxin module
MGLAKVSEGGGVVIPAEMLEKYGIGVGDTVVWIDNGEQLVLSSMRASIKKAQQLVAKYDQHPESSMVDELIRERRAEAARE